MSHASKETLITLFVWAFGYCYLEVQWRMKSRRAVQALRDLQALKEAKPTPPAAETLEKPYLRLVK